MIDPVHLIGTRLPRLLAPRYPDLLWRLPTQDRVLYLTFDDGPTTTLTPRLLDLLDRFDVPASFFLVGENAQRHPDLVRAISDAGHTIGNHSFTHVDAWRTSTSVLFHELERTTTLLENLARSSVRLMRPPYGRFTTTMRRWCQLRRQRCTMWDVGPGDYLASTTRRHIEQRVLRHIRPGSIVVLHDNPKAASTMPAALETILARLTSDGWRFAAL